MFVSDDEKVYLEVPEVSRITGLSKNQIYSISGEEVPSKKDPRNNSRTLLEAEEVFLARGELESEGKIGDHNFRKWEDVDFSKDRIVRSVVNKMYRNRYDLEDLDLLHMVNNKRRKPMSRDSQGFEERYKFVQDKCFGWADPDCEECTEHCELFEECLEERNENVLPELAEKFEERDRAASLEDELEESEQEIQDMVDTVESDISELEDGL